MQILEKGCGKTQETARCLTFFPSNVLYHNVSEIYLWKKCFAIIHHDTCFGTFVLFMLQAMYMNLFSVCRGFPSFN